MSVAMSVAMTLNASRMVLLLASWYSILIQDVYLYGTSFPLFKLSKLTKLIKERISSLGAGTFKVNCTRKEQLNSTRSGTSKGQVW